jgi:hypothetical protein
MTAQATGRQAALFSGVRTDLSENGALPSSAAADVAYALVRAVSRLRPPEVSWYFEV